MSDRLQEAIAAIKVGNKTVGKQLLIETLKADQRSETAWLWMTQVVNTNEERIKCLQNVLKINPHSEIAKKGLSKFQLKQPGQRTGPPKIEKQRSQRPSPVKPTLPPKKKASPILVILIIALVVCCGFPVALPVVSNSMRQVGLLPTFTPSPTRGPTSTPTITPIPTSTPRPTATVDPEITKARWSTVDIRDLAKNPDGYIGREVHYRGEVFSIEESSDGSAMQVWVDIPGGSEFDQEAVIVFFEGKTDNIYEGTEVEFWGYCSGAFEGTNAFGGTIQQPLILAEYLTYFY